MKATVVYYTRFGHNTTIAETIAAQLRAGLVRVETRRQYGYALMGFYSFFNLGMKIKPLPLDHSDLDLLLLCAPVWAWKPAPPVRTFLKNARLPGRLAACLSTGGGPSLRAQEKLSQMLKPRSVEIIAFGEIDTSPEDPELLRREACDFADRVRAAVDG